MLYSIYVTETDRGEHLGVYRITHPEWKKLWGYYRTNHSLRLKPCSVRPNREWTVFVYTNVDIWQIFHILIKLNNLHFPLLPLFMIPPPCAHPQPPPPRTPVGRIITQRKLSLIVPWPSTRSCVWRTTRTLAPSLCFLHYGCFLCI